MLIWTARFTRKKAVLSILAFGLIMVILILLTGRIRTKTAPVPQLTDTVQRVEYLQSLGWEVDAEPLETLQFLLPETLEEPYLSYNELQLKQGFDLTSCCGKQITRYTYHVKNYPERPDGVQANLYICEDLPVAGDLCCPGADGFQSALIPVESPQK